MVTISPGRNQWTGESVLWSHTPIFNGWPNSMEGCQGSITLGIYTLNAMRVVKRKRCVPLLSHHEPYPFQPGNLDPWFRGVEP
ncbi:hypothetical protein AVEN_270528-1 [Araneus ventricosus]|uniref:Uncharacterized protein n=1 Tax=Araneus ventricosus TaxID=182803 RepID=A0A4Y2B5I0_ARAVE|nr:hypothetical protein AVEN_270528-1 [Araneus ventricosus]